jgi:hypothetical protein
MKIGNTFVRDLKFVEEKTRITVLTKDGTIMANGILTTTICSDYIDVYGNGLDVLERWKK